MPDIDAAIEVSIPFASGLLLNKGRLATFTSWRRLNPFCFRATAEHRGAWEEPPTPGLNPFCFRATAERDHEPGDIDSFAVSIPFASGLLLNAGGPASAQPIAVSIPFASGLLLNTTPI